MGIVQFYRFPLVILTQRRMYLFYRFPGGDIITAGYVPFHRFLDGDINSANNVFVLQVSWW